MRLAEPEPWLERLRAAGFAAAAVAPSTTPAVVAKTASLLVIADDGEAEATLAAIAALDDPCGVVVVEAQPERVEALLRAGAEDVLVRGSGCLSAERRLSIIARCLHHRQELEFLRRFVKAAPDVVLAADRDYRIVYVNSNPARVGRNLFDFVSPKHHAVLAHSLDRVFDDGLEASYVVNQADVDPPRWWSTRLAPLSEHGAVTMVAMVARDITESVLVERELKATKAELEVRVARRTEELVQINSALRAEIVERRRLEEELRAVASLKKAFANTVIEAQEQERKRVARELHDAIGQVLLALKMDADWIDGKLDGRSEAAAVARDLSGKLGHTIDAVRNVIRDLRPPMLDELGVSSALEAFALQLSQRPDVTCELVVDAEDLPAVEPEIATGVFRIGQEALYNAVRHAGASRVTLTLEANADEIVLTIKDDGCGMPDDALEAHRSVGLIGMRERASLLRGRFTITARQGHGTTICARIPLSEGKRIQALAHA